MIASGSRTEAVVVTVTIRQEEKLGRGSAVPYASYGETFKSVAAAIHLTRPKISVDVARAEKAADMPPGTTRNDIDCTLRTLEYKLTEQIAAQLAVIANPAHLIVGANYGSRSARLAENIEAYLDFGIELIEEPSPGGDDSALIDRLRGIAVCIDESIHIGTDLPHLRQHYDATNPKFDKTGGLTDTSLAQGRRSGAGLHHFDWPHAGILAGHGSRIRLGTRRGLCRPGGTVARGHRPRSPVFPCRG